MHSRNVALEVVRTTSVRNFRKHSQQDLEGSRADSLAILVTALFNAVTLGIDV